VLLCLRQVVGHELFSLSVDHELLSLLVWLLDFVCHELELIDASRSIRVVMTVFCCDELEICCNELEICCNELEICCDELDLGDNG
jgi:hypothetical protein